MTLGTPEIPASLLGNWISPEDLARDLRLSIATLADWRSQRRGPAYLKVGRKIWYPRIWVEKWLQSRLKETTDVTAEPKRDLALPIRARRQRVRTNNRLGRHATKHERCTRPGVPASAGAAGRAKYDTSDSDPPIR